MNGETLDILYREVDGFLEHAEMTATQAGIVVRAEFHDDNAMELLMEQVPLAIFGQTWGKRCEQLVGICKMTGCAIWIDENLGVVGFC